MEAPPRTNVVRLSSPDERPSLNDIGVKRGHPVIAFAGTTADLDPELGARLYPFIRTLTATAADLDAVIVTGGTDAGVIRLLGLSLGSLSGPPLLIGVAPEGLVRGDGTGTGPESVDADPNLDALVLVPGARWGDETATQSRLVSTIAHGQPTVLVVVGGGAGARAEVVEHARQKRPIVVLSRSGRLADELADLRREVQLPDSPTAPISVREVHVVDLLEPPSRLRALLSLLLRDAKSPTLRRRFPVLSVWPRLRRPHVSSTLPFGLDAGQMYPDLHDAIVEGYREVYPLFAECDQIAVREQQRYRVFVAAAILGGLLTTVFGAIQAALPAVWWPGVVVATLGAFTTAVTTVARRQGALDAYLSARIRAERLRSLYVMFVAGASGAAAPARELQLRSLQESIAHIRFGEVKK